MLTSRQARPPKVALLPSMQLTDLRILPETRPSAVPQRNPSGTRSSGSCTTDGWTITWIQSSPGSVQVNCGGTGVVVVVGDDERISGLSTSLLLSRTGGALVRAASAPPGLLVSEHYTRTVPGIPGVDDCVTLAPGDRLLVLSADALEALPVTRPRQHRPWVDQVHQQPPAEFLARLFRDVEGGSGAIMTLA